MRTAAESLVPDGDAPPADPPGPSAHWIGFTELEEWLASIDPARPALLLPVARPAGHDGPFRTERLLVACQQVTAEGHVLYCHLLGATLTRVCGEIVDADWRFRAMAWESLWECVEETLAERGLAVLPAMLAFPEGLGPAAGPRARHLLRQNEPLLPLLPPPLPRLIFPDLTVPGSDRPSCPRRVGAGFSLAAAGADGQRRAGRQRGVREGPARAWLGP